MRRAAFFIDGFNFYHPIASLKLPHLKWMSYWDLAGLLLPRSESLVSVKVFTAFATHLPNSMTRHRLAVKAWEAQGCECVMGQFKKKRVHCKNCNKESLHHEEKESDVNIAIHLLNDARLGKMDVAYIISTDSDLAPAFKMCSVEFPAIELVTVAPPTKVPGKAILAHSARSISVNQRHVESCLMPGEVYDGNGKLAAVRPAEYKPPT